MSFWVAGVDGCKVGWLCVLKPIGAQTAPRVLIAERFVDLLALPEAPRVIAVDVPIGLPERALPGGRACDVGLRRHLGARQSSVFAVPARAAVMLSDYGEACAAALHHSEPPRKVSKQCFNIFPKIREVDAALTPALQERIVECHPEGAFWAMNGKRALVEPKKVKSRPYPPGLALRRELLLKGGFQAAFLDETRFRASQAGTDDFLDACACAWTAERIHRGEAKRFPDDPPRDARSLRMEIWA